MEENMPPFSVLCFIISRKVKNASKMQRKICVVWGEGAVMDWTY